MHTLFATHKSKRALFLVSLVLAIVAFGHAAWAAESSCVRCHTSAETMKALYHPPAMPASEGEG